MSRRGKFKKKYIFSVLCIAIPVILTLIVINNSYSIWTTQLNITGRATAERQVLSLELSPVLISSGRYTNLSGNQGLLSDYITWNSDTIDSSNSLSTRIEDTGYVQGLRPNCTLTITFNLKNTSSEGITYTNGNWQVDTEVDPGSALSKNTIKVNRATIAPGQQAQVTINTTIQRKKLQNGTYVKFVITYYVVNEIGEEVPYNYYYTLYISK